MFNISFNYNNQSFQTPRCGFYLERYLSVLNKTNGKRSVYKDVSNQTQRKVRIAEHERVDTKQIKRMLEDDIKRKEVRSILRDVGKVVVQDNVRICLEQICAERIYLYAMQKGQLKNVI